MWLSTGNLDYIGRNDFKVKIRGYRIELKEIENVLSSYIGIKYSVVLAKDYVGIDGNISVEPTHGKYLVSYYLSDYRLDEKEIIRYLQTKLPDYMVPSVFVHLENLPLTINGKLDRKALPDPEFVNVDGYVAPRNDIEIKVCQIWSEVLGLSQDKIGITDDFFRLGGDSIVSIQLVSRLRQRLALNVNVKDIFEFKTISRLYDNVLSKCLDDTTKIFTKNEQGHLSGEVSLLPIQQWFLENNFTRENHWNQSFLIKTPTLDIDKLQVSLAKLIEHHDSFRLKYKKFKKIIKRQANFKRAIDSNYIQYYDSDNKIENLKILDIRSLDSGEKSTELDSKLQSILTEWQSNFNLERGPVYNIGYIYGYKDGTARVYFSLHHLIVDTVSWRILVEDLQTLYNEGKLDTKKSSYRQWVTAVKEYSNSIEHEKNYWHNVLIDYDYNTLNKLIVNANSKNYSNVQLSRGKTEQLLRESNRAYNTGINDILLTSLAYVLYEVTGSKVNHIVLEGHGREEIDKTVNINRTVGWFTTMYPVRLELANNIASSIKAIKENLRKVPNKGIGYGSLIGYQQNVLPRISFNYLGQFDKKENTNVQNFWNIVSEGSGEPIHPLNQDSNVIDINGMIINYKLQFTIKSKLGKRITKQLAQLFTQKLEEIITHTTKQTRSYLTVSDIDNIISVEYLDKLQEFREIEGVYLCNSLQQGFVYHDLNQGNVDSAYRGQLIWKYNSRLEIDKLREAWAYAQRKFSSLRLRFC